MRQFVVTVPVDEADLAVDRLWQLGVRAVEERSPVDGSGRGASEIEASAGGSSVELWTCVGDADDALKRAADAMEPSWEWRIVDVDVTAETTWREYVTPIWVDEDVVIVPAWVPRPDLDDRVTVVEIETGAAFGLGDHPTTLACARELRHELQRRTSGVSVLDVGCGTGVLSVVAALGGARTVRSIDVSDGAVEATRENAERNSVGARVQVDSTPLSGVEGPFDVVVANILAPTLVAMADDLERVTAPDGVLIISGILAASHAHVLAALRSLRTVSTIEIDGWVAVSLTH